MGIQLFIVHFWLIFSSKIFPVSLLAQEAIRIKNSSGTTEGLLIGFNCAEGTQASPNLYAYSAIWSSYWSQVLAFVRVSSYLMKIANQAVYRLFSLALQQFLLLQIFMVTMTLNPPLCRPPFSLYYQPKWSKRKRLRQLLQICWKSGSKKPIDRRSSVHGDLVCVKSPLGLEWFEVGKNWISYKNCEFRSLFWSFSYRKLLQYNWRSTHNSSVLKGVWRFETPMVLRPIEGHFRDSFSSEIRPVTLLA